MVAPFLRRTRGRRAVPALVVLLAGTACAGGAPARPSPPPAPAADPPAVHWYRTSAEQRAVYEEVYRWAAASVEGLAAERAPGSWAVILDADETVLDNSTYQLRRARAGLGYTSESWNAWVREEAAAALPGAAAFVRRVHELGGRAAIVTNRDSEVCPETLHNLRAVGVAADMVLCRAPGEPGKEARFRAVREGTTGSGLGPLEVLVWVGDNIRDFPGGSQAWRGGALPPEVGVRWFVLPNPMYGSWEDNPPR